MEYFNIQADDIMIVDCKGRTVLQNAVRCGNLETVQIIIEKGNLQQQHLKHYDMYGNNLLFSAIESGNIAIVSLLIEKGNYQKREMMYDSLIFCPLLKAVRLNRLDIIRLLLDKGNFQYGDISRYYTSEALCDDIKQALSPYIVKTLEEHLIAKEYDKVFEMCNLQCNPLTEKINEIQCYICYEPLTNVLMTSCKHYYCVECFITIYFIRKHNTKTCSFCRQVFTNNVSIKMENDRKSVLQCAIES